MLKNNIGYLPVMNRKQVIGLVTRTGTLRMLFDSVSKNKAFSGRVEKEKNNKTYPSDVSVIMRRAFPKKAIGIISEMARLAEDEGCKAYLVGGFVRDLLLGVKNLDIDIVIEGDALRFARYASEKMGATLVEHRKFGTAALIMPNSPEDGARVKIDIATARKEFYKHPAALPSVEFSSMKNDLYRRDFTINAMAVSIIRKDFGRLIDFFGGVKDLSRKRIRVLHEKSFIDDPTRIFRAVRFEQRYDFKIDDRTARLIKNAVKARMFNKVSGERLREEIVLLLKEKEPLRAIKRMNDLHELRFISPKMRFGAKEEALCGRVKKMIGIYGAGFLVKRSLDLWLIYFMAMIDRLSLNDALKVCDRFVIRRGDRLRIISAKKSGEKIIRFLSGKGKIAPSKVYRALEPLSYETLIFLTAKCADRLFGGRVKDFLTKYNGVRLSVAGADLKRLGAVPGPCFTMILKKTLYAKIDGNALTKQDELLFAEKEIKRIISDDLPENRRH